MAAKRNPAAPEIPTMVEQGFPNLVVEAWVTLLGPKNMDPALVRKMHGAAMQAFSNDAVKLAKTQNLLTPGRACLCRCCS